MPTVKSAAAVRRRLAVALCRFRGPAGVSTWLPPFAKGSPSGLRSAAVVILAVTSGATDAVAFLALGGAFTSVMTGNLVLLGISLGQRDPVLAEQILLAVLGYIGGCAAGVRIAGIARGDDPVWPPAVTRALVVETGLFLVYAIGWWGVGGDPGGAMKPLLLGVCAFALGIQSSAVRRFGVSGLSTTYLTGTLTTLVMRLASGGRLRDLAQHLALLMALVTGAVAVALLLRLRLGKFAPLVSLLPLVVVLAIAFVARSAAGHKTVT
jgi:uncharacterized membrane protein YoaK (UPF0700 family)